MGKQLENTLVLAISSRALFDLSESHHVFETQGVEAYYQYQAANENNILSPGIAYPLIEKLLALNTNDIGAVEIVLLSRNSADTGLRIFNSIRHYDLAISRAVFTGGATPYRYAEAFGAQLFLSADAEDVRKALQAGIAAATILPSQPSQNRSTELRIAFDGDAVLFSDEAEQIYQAQGLAAFTDSEMKAAHLPLASGPFKPFLSALHRIQHSTSAQHALIRTALVTARSAPAHERVIRTLRAWGIRIDEAVFLGGLDKALFLQAFGADIFFDDQQKHCESASQLVPTGHVPHGVVNNRNPIIQAE